MIDKESIKRSQDKYLRSAKGIAARRRAIQRYNDSVKGRRSRRKYLLSSKGIEATERAKQNRKYLN